MTKRTYSLCSLGLLLGLGLSGVQLNAQQAADPQSPNSPSQPPAQQQTAPDSQAQSQQAQVQTFAGTIVKAGDKYVLQDASGTSFDVDRQDLVKPHEGKKVRINGTLDADGKTIHVK
ncbi:MAG: DUF5818 domain-containing protein [Terriglobales bacterium]|jgi:uncharacterized protein YdeI (BOF family)